MKNAVLVTNNIAQSLSQLQTEFTKAKFFTAIENAALIVKTSSSADESIKFDFSEFPKTSGGSSLTSSAQFIGADNAVSTQTFNHVAAFAKDGKAVANDLVRLTKFAEEKLVVPAYLRS